MKTEAGADARGERRALAELYIRQVPSAIGLAYLITGDRHMAEDMAQEAFVRLGGGSAISGPRRDSTPTCARRW